MTRIKVCKKLPDNRGERTALKTKKMIHHKKMPSECLGYSKEMKNCSFVHQEQGSVMKGKT